MSSDTSVASADSLSYEQWRARWRPAVAGVLAKGRSGDLPAEPERLLDSPTYEGFPVRPLYTAWTRCPNRRCPAGGRSCAAATRCATSSPAGRSPERFPARRRRVADGNGAVLVALTEGVSALVLRVGEPAARRPANWTACSRACSSTWCRSSSTPACDYVAAADAVLALVTDLDDDQRARLSMDLGADPLTAPLSGRPAPSVDRRRGDRGQGRPDYDGGVRAITVDGPAFHNLGASASWELAGSVAAGGRATCGCSATAGLAVADALRQISFRFAADDDQFMTIAKLRAARQLWARVAEVVGAAGRGRRHGARGHVAADDGAARPVGEHAAHHAGGVRRGRRRRRHRAGAAVRRGDPRRFARHRTEFRPPHRPQHPTAAAGGVPHRPGARPGGRVVVRRGPHRAARRAGVGALPGHRVARRLRRGPRLRRRADRRGARPPRRRHRAPAHRAHRCQRVPEPRRTAAAAS